MFGSQQNLGETEIPVWSSQENGLFSSENLQAIRERFVQMKQQKLFVLKERYFFRYNNTTPHRQAAIRAMFKNLLNNELPYELNDSQEARRKGRKRNAGLIAQNKNISSTQRDSSGFGYALVEQQARSRKCSNCTETGHNKRNCPKKQQALYHNHTDEENAGMRYS